MKKIISTLIMMTMMLTLFVVTPTQVEASEVESTEDVLVDGSYLTTDTESTVVVYPRTRGVYLLSGSGTITQQSTKVVGVAGTTTATMTVSSVKVSATLQRYVSGSWVSVETWENTAYSTNYVSLFTQVSVTGGYYYRVLSNHWAYTEWTQGVTNGIWIAS
ncbi:MAG: DUF6147 family protein [Eubacteriales bacterium]